MSRCIRVRDHRARRARLASGRAPNEPGSRPPPAAVTPTSRRARSWVIGTHRGSWPACPVRVSGQSCSISMVAPVRWSMSTSMGPSRLSAISASQTGAPWAVSGSTPRTRPRQRSVASRPACCALTPPASPAVGTGLVGTVLVGAGGCRGHRGGWRARRSRVTGTGGQRGERGAPAEHRNSCADDRHGHGGRRHHPDASTVASVVTPRPRPEFCSGSRPGISRGRTALRADLRRAGIPETQVDAVAHGPVGDGAAQRDDLVRPARVDPRACGQRPPPPVAGEPTSFQNGPGLGGRYRSQSQGLSQGPASP